MREIPEESVVAHLGRGDVRPAVEALRSAPPKRRESGAGLRGAVLRVLENRGFHTRTPSALRDSLEEIHAIGPGFDLYDLCEILAARESPEIPELSLFVKEHP